MKKKFFLILLLAFLGLSNVLNAQNYNHVVEPGDTVFLSSADAGQSITIGVIGGGNFVINAIADAVNPFWDTENCGCPNIDHIMSCGPGTYYAASDNHATVTIEIIWVFTFNISGNFGEVDTMYVSTGDPVDLPLNNGNFDGVLLYDASENCLGIDNVSITPVVGVNLYIAHGFDNSGHESIDSLRIIYTAATSAGGDIMGTVSVYPNPVTNFLFIMDVNEFNSVSVLDISGKIVYSDTVDGNNITVDFIDMPSGVYLVKLSGGKRVSVITITKK